MAALAERRNLSEQDKIARRAGSKPVKVLRKKANGKTCRARTTDSTTVVSSSATTTSSTSTSAAVSTTATSSQEVASASSTTSSYTISSSADDTVTTAASTTAVVPSVNVAVLAATHTSTSSSAEWTSSSASSSSAAPASTQVSTGNVLNAYSDACGNSNSDDSHPNGSPDWLNCGLYSGGWTPPYVKISQLVSTTADMSSEGFSACAAYQSIFEAAANTYGVPATLLMAIAMQESGCNKDAIGSRLEQGLMQVAGNACDSSNPSGPACRDPWYNIHKGAWILVSDKMGGNLDSNIILALGQYNGWFEKMAVGSGAEYGPAGQKISYLNDMLNMRMQGKNPYGG